MKHLEIQKTGSENYSLNEAKVYAKKESNKNKLTLGDTEKRFELKSGDFPFINIPLWLDWYLNKSGMRNCSDH